ncbi:ankyrin repeat-containing domain protein [Mycena belliarum]|uniref:Ankyrin repeat-containing domain protein n=1 Tax=Mycena belliarum TaxID=1033014 RepID=A0AAD6TSL6_9AGAR|nr:ankyrin repeat-containing domain protein [Mycena belliae]
MVINYLQAKFQSTGSGVACIYLNHKEIAAQTLVNLLASIWKQLAVGKPLALSVHTLYRHHRERNTSPSVQEVAQILQILIAQMSQVYLVIDALDEYPEQQRRALLDQLSMLLGPTTRLMITSRSHVDFCDIFPALLAVKIQATDEDILSYIDTQIRLAPRLSKHVQRQPQLRDEINHCITSKVDGMFLLAKLHITALSSKNTVKDVRQALRDMPQTLDQTYEEAMERILSQSSEDKELALRTLTWVAYTKRPLSVAELVEALAIEPGADSIDTDNLLDIGIVLAVCAGLLVVDEQMSVVRLIHYTTQHYFDRVQSTKFPDAHQIIAAHCLAYWSFDVVAQAAESLTYRLSEDLDLPSPPLLEYCAYTFEHIAEAPRQSDLMATMADGSELPYYISCYQKYYARLWYSFDEWDPNPWHYWDWPTFPSWLWIAAAWNLLQMAVTIFGESFQKDAEAALCVAAYFRHEEIIGIILEGAVTMSWNIDLKDAFYCASENGRISVVQLLLDHGADVNAKRGRNETVLHATCCKGHKRVAQLLIDHGADLNCSGGKYGTALQAAISEGYQEIAQLLLDRGADVNARGRRFETALHAASYVGNTKVIQLLIDHGADVNAKGRDGTALQAASASQYHNVAVIQLLLEHGADINARGGDYETALQAASYKDHREIAQLLLDHGADVNTKGGYYGTALQAASYEGYNESVQLLLDHGAEVNSLAGMLDGQTEVPLWDSVRHSCRAGARQPPTYSTAMDCLVYIYRTLVLTVRSSDLIPVRCLHVVFTCHRI